MPPPTATPPCFENPDQPGYHSAPTPTSTSPSASVPHVCIGKRVAQMQLEAVYDQLLTRFPDMRYTGGVDIAPNNFVFAIRKLPVEFTPERKAA